jgi:hypothetical protein
MYVLEYMYLFSPNFVDGRRAKFHDEKRQPTVTVVVEPFPASTENRHAIFRLAAFTALLV